jgi:fumarate hydratase class II
MIVSATKYLYDIPMGGTAVGTGFGAPKGYDAHCVAAINELLNSNKFRVSPNKYQAT